MGSRKYLLENDDFFALRDLEDLSKGAFAGIMCFDEFRLFLLPKVLYDELNVCKIVYCIKFSR
jgi:run domain Beclin-1 interacting cysteine-rich containing protein